MVEIVGKDQKYVKRITCEKCASILEYTDNELKKYSGTDYSGGADGHEWIDCPCCGNKVITKSW